MTSIPLWQVTFGKLRQQLEKAMNEAAELLLGIRDFSTFRSSGRICSSVLPTDFAGV